MTELSERAERILFHVIDEFIRNGEPVASSAVASLPEIDVSPATVRNVMSDLETGGLLVQPHTSAGRVPTASGIRRYVDLLKRHGEAEAGAAVGSELIRVPHAAGPEDLARWAGTLLSEESSLAGLVLGPDLNIVTLREVRLVSLGPTRVLVLFVTDEGSAVERVVTLETPIDARDLLPMQNYLEELGRGRTLRQLRDQVSRELTVERTQYHDLARRSLELTQQVVDSSRADLHVEGAFNVVEFGGGLEQMRALLRALEEKERVVSMLDQICATPTPLAVIGPEMGWDLGEELSLVLCGFYRGGEQAGLVGILGPLRMDYAHVIPLVDRVARVLSKELDSTA